MTTILTSSSKRFAIEYAIEMEFPAYGQICFHLGEHLLGDFNRRTYLYHIAKSLQSIRMRTLVEGQALFLRESDVPAFESVAETGYMSWGESFDDFRLFYYAVMETKELHFVWELYETARIRFPNYPTNRSHVIVPFTEFDEVIDSFLANIRLE